MNYDEDILIWLKTVQRYVVVDSAELSGLAQAGLVRATRHLSKHWDPVNAKAEAFLLGMNYRVLRVAWRGGTPPAGSGRCAP